MISPMIKSLSVVIPAYNEEPNVASCLITVDSVLKKLHFKDTEIIFVDDGSKDGTGQVAKSFMKKIKNLKVVANYPNRGYGGSLRAGFAASSKEFIAFFPVDNQFDFKEISKLITTQEKTGADIVSGVRVGGGADPFFRKINRWGWNFVVRLMFGKLVTDIDCGFKLFRREILKNIHLTAERGAMIDTQLFAAAKARGYKFSEIPLTHLPRKAGSATGADFRVVLQSFMDLVVFWWQLKKELWTEKN
jgi:glycosyltransferase involved in cell wall biosynthesis